MRYYYLSFAKPEGFLGAVCVKAEDELGAVGVVNSLGLNPGGEIAICSCEPCDDFPFPFNKLLSRGDLERLDPDGPPTRYGDASPEEQRLIDANTVTICEHCNQRH